MTRSMLITIAAAAIGLIGLFLFVTVHEFRRMKRVEQERAARRAAAERAPHPLMSGPMRILLATDGSPCSDCAVDSVAARPWPPESEVEIVSVVHTRVPLVPDVFLGGAAAHVTALEESRQHAPEHIQRAAERLGARPDVTLSSTILEGPPAETIAAEAARRHADLIVVGSHGYNAAKRTLLGSVSQDLALHAPCSVEIVRCTSGHTA
jgi:nucleotide-binding universal stress UspA family protein